LRKVSHIMKFEDFTKEERTAIAEFVLAYDNDVFIKSDAEKMISIFFAKEMIYSEDSACLSRQLKDNENILEELIEILFSSVDVSVGKQIMDEYHIDCLNIDKQ